MKLPCELVIAYYPGCNSIRWNEEIQIDAFSYVSIEDRFPARHPIRPMRMMVNEILESLDDELGPIYSDSGRPSIAPEYLLRASVLQILYSGRSERQLMDRIDLNILFGWFVGLGIYTPVVDHSTFTCFMSSEIPFPGIPAYIIQFTKNRDRLLESDIARLFFAKVVEQARLRKFLSDEHFTVDGTLIEAWQA